VRQLDNVTFLEGHDVVEPVVCPPDRVSAVRIVDRATAETRVLDTDLVVDATGRSARTPAFLEAHGYDRPVEAKYAVNLSYSSQFFRIPVGALTDKIAVVAPTLERPTGIGVLAYEDDTAILTLIGIAGHELPTDLAGVLAVAAELLPADYMAALRAAEPLGDVSAQRYPASVWRRYDKLDRFPKGLLVIGDAVCSFNPVWGQGMTSAALQAAALYRCLSESDTDDVSRRYFRYAAKKLVPIWRTNRLVDFSITPADDWRSIPKRFMNWWIGKTFAAAANDVELTETYFRTVVLVDSPTALLRPGRLRRVLTG
jgi:2-polyprenyl-6-methoxyphenol hydroxylase-like FAD-dependent oxidoreductase